MSDYALWAFSWFIRSTQTSALFRAVYKMDRNYTASSRNAIRPYSNRRASFSLAENVEQLNRSLDLQDEEEDLSAINWVEDSSTLLLHDVRDTIEEKRLVTWSFLNRVEALQSSNLQIEKHSLSINQLRHCLLYLLFTHCLDYLSSCVLPFFCLEMLYSTNASVYLI